MKPKQIVITGVSRGLGLALAEGFIARGHVVHGCARSSDAVVKLRERLGVPHTFEVVDVSHDDQVATWARRIFGANLEPDLVLNNAAQINANAPLWKVSAHEFDQLMAVNVSGVVNVVRHFAPPMIARRHGIFVNFSSGWGRSVSPEVAPYCASKWAIEGLSKALAEELPPGMASIPLNPGIIDTEMLRSCFGADATGYPDARRWAERAVPFLLELSPQQTGQSLTVR